MSHACGFSHVNFWTVPETVSGWFTSYSAAKAWCARRAGGAGTIRNNTRAAPNRRGMNPAATLPILHAPSARPHPPLGQDGTRTKEQCPSSRLRSLARRWWDGIAAKSAE